MRPWTAMEPPVLIGETGGSSVFERPPAPMPAPTLARRREGPTNDEPFMAASSSLNTIGLKEDHRCDCCVTVQRHSRIPDLRDGQVVCPQRALSTFPSPCLG
jgi:hypothetical protein